VKLLLAYKAEINAKKTTGRRLYLWRRQITTKTWQNYCASMAAKN